MSVRLEIVQRSVVKLNTNRPGSVPEARLRRPLPITSADTVPTATELNLYFAIEDMRPATNKHSPLTKKELILIVEARAPTTDPTKVEEELEPIHTWVEKVLSGENLDNYVHQITPVQLRWTPVFADKVYAVSYFRFLVEYQTKRDDPDEVQ